MVLVLDRRVGFSMNFGFDFVQRVKQANDIVDVVSSFGLTPKKKGKSYVCLCPFHNDHSPSMHLAPDGQYYYCFVCGEGGDVIKFVQKRENITFVEAVQRLAETARIPLEFEGAPEASRDYAQKANQKKRLVEINRAAEQWFAQNLNSPAGRPLQEYLLKRGITQETWTGFGVGYAPKGWSGLLEVLSNQGYDGAELDAAGLTATNAENGRRRDFFMDRIMFPIRDLQGKTVGFSGRQAPGNEFGGKYINTPGTALFNKSAALFGVDLATAEIRERDCAILVEGQLDVLAMHQAGWRNTVAASGSAVTEQHLQILRRLCSKVLVATDGDAAGLKAAERALAPLIQMDIPCKIAVLPEGLDPADILLAENGAVTIGQALEQARDAFDFKLGQLRGSRTVLEIHETAEVARGMLELFHLTPDPLKLQRWREQIGLRLGLAPNSLPVPKVAPVRSERVNRPPAEAAGAGEPPADFIDGDPYEDAADFGATDRPAVPANRPLRPLDPAAEALIRAERDLIWLLLHHPNLMLEAETRVDFYAFLDWRHLCIATGLMLALQGPSLSQRRILDGITRAEYDQLQAGEGIAVTPGVPPPEPGRCAELTIQLLERKHSASRIFSETLASEHLRGAVDALRRLQIREQLRRIKMQLQEPLEEQEKISLENRKSDLMRELVVLGNPTPV